MQLNEKQNNFTIEDLQKVGENMDIRSHKVIVEEVAESILHWMGYKKDYDVKADHADTIGKTVPVWQVSTYDQYAGYRPRTRAVIHQCHTKR